MDCWWWYMNGAWTVKCPRPWQSQMPMVKKRRCQELCMRKRKDKKPVLIYVRLRVNPSNLALPSILLFKTCSVNIILDCLWLQLSNPMWTVRLLHFCFYGGSMSALWKQHFSKSAELHIMLTADSWLVLLPCSEIFNHYFYHLIYTVCLTFDGAKYSFI